jgi:hypothetical protein
MIKIPKMEDYWIYFEKAAIDSDVSKELKLDFKKAFFAGIQALMCGQIIVVQNFPSEEDYFKAMNNWREECEEFFNSFREFPADFNRMH